MNQSGNFSNATGYHDFNIENWRTLFNTVGGMEVVLGTFLNLWLLVAILTCPTLRQSMRNKLICNLAVALALESMITLPVDLAKIFIRRLSDSYFHHCQINSLVKNLQLINDFIPSWIVVIILVFYLADILDYDPSKRLTALSLRLATTGVLLLPWVGCLITLPSITTDYYNRQPDIHKTVTCFALTYDSLKIFKTVDTIVPVIVSMILLALSIIFRRSKFVPIDTNNTELIGQGHQVDSPLAYITIVGVVIACQLLTIVYLFGLFVRDYKTWVIIYFSSFYTDTARVILLPLSCLLFPDLRQRLLTCRPWKRALPGINLTVVYEKDTS